MYSECIKCQKIGISCDGPNFFAMDASELHAWCKERKKEIKASNAQLAEMSGMPKGTIDRFFAGEHIDFRYETIRPLLKALTGGAWSGNPCAAPEEEEALQKKIQELEAEIAKRDESLQQYKKNYEDLTTLVANTNKRHEEQLHFLRGEIKRKNKFVTGLAILSVVALLYIIVTLVIDVADPSRGFYWLEGLLHLPQSIINQTGVNT